MKKIFTIIIGAIIVLLTSCEPQQDEINFGITPSNGLITVDDSKPHNPIFTATADNGFLYDWDFGNGDIKKGQEATVTSYFPFANDYNITCTIYGAGGNIVTTKIFNVASTDPTIANMPVWKELTGSGTGKTWVYNTDPTTGTPDYCYQTVNDLDIFPDNWMPSASWGQCVRITPDINGEMVFDLNGGTNYTYHQIAEDQGIKGSFILDTKLMTLTIKNPYIFDYNIECTNPAYTSTGVYQIKKLTEDEMVLWQYQTDSYLDENGTKVWGTGWGWSFKKK